MTRVLIIDDDKSVSLAIETLLRPQGCVVTLADGGHAGASALETSGFDLIMIDIFMPGVNGLETIKSFRERVPTLPIIAMSGFRFRGPATPALDFLAMAAKLGATYCLRKPFSPQQLMAAIDACLGEQSPKAPRLASA